MPRGIPRVKAVEMTDAELSAMENTDVKVAGNLTAQQISDVELKARLQAQKLFPKIPVSYNGWIDVTFEEMAEHEKKGQLAGYDPSLGKALITKRG